MKKELKNTEQDLFLSIKNLVDGTRSSVTQKVNFALTVLYWNIGKQINNVVLQNQRASYGKLIVASLAEQLTVEYGKGFSKASLSRMCTFNQHFSNFEIVATLSQQLSWSHFIELIPIKNDLERQFYTQLCRVERWSVQNSKHLLDNRNYLPSYLKAKRK
jgi:hypothetical protein